MNSTAQDTVPPVWQDRNYLTYWCGFALSVGGDQISTLALPLIAIGVLHASALQVSVLTALLWVPYLFSLFVGTWVDHHGRQQRLLIAADLCQCLGIAAVPAAYAAGGLNLAVLYGGAVILGSGSVLAGCAAQSFFVRLVPETQYVQAMSITSSTLSLASLVGPAIGGVLVQSIGAPNAVIVDACTFVASAAAISVVRTRRPASPGTRDDDSYADRLRSGVAYLLRHRYLRASLAASTAMNFGSFMIQAVLILFANRTLHMSAGHIGLALALGAVGGLIGAATAARFAGRVGIGHAMLIGGGLSVVPYAALVLAHGPGTGFALLAAAEFAAAWAVMQYDINNNAVRATVTDDTMRGRVACAYSMINYGSRPLGALTGGWIATALNTRATFLIAGIIAITAIGIIANSPMIRVRSLDAT